MSSTAAHAAATGAATATAAGHDSNIKYIVVHMRQVDGVATVFRTDLYVKHDIGYYSDVNKFGITDNPYRLICNSEPEPDDVAAANARDPMADFLKGAEQGIAAKIAPLLAAYYTAVDAFDKNQNGAGAEHVSKILDNIPAVHQLFQYFKKIKSWFVRQSRDGKTESYNTSIVDAMRYIDVAVANTPAIDKHKMLAAWLTCTNVHLAAINAICVMEPFPGDAAIKGIYDGKIKADAVIGDDILTITTTQYTLASNQIEKNVAAFNAIINHITEPDVDAAAKAAAPAGAQAGGGAHTRRRHRRSLRRTLKNIGL
jgi:hypothetical protein